MGGGGGHSPMASKASRTLRPEGPARARLEGPRAGVGFWEGAAPSPPARGLWPRRLL